MTKVKVQQKRGLAEPEKADIEVARAAALDEATPLARAAHAVGGLGDQPPMTAASATILACGVALRDRRMARAGLRMLGALGLATFMKTLVKDRIDRTRPSETLSRKRYKLKPGKSKAKAERSMPSGHSAGVAAVLRAAARDYPGARLPLFAGAGAVAGAQIPTRNHYVSDVAAGVAIGLVAEALVSAAIDALDERLDA